VFLDRDGVINVAIVRNGKPFPPQTLEELSIFPEVPDALFALRNARFRLVVVTNQPDVARGTQKRSVVEAINGELISRLPLEAVQVCYHDDADGCGCRKPKPGLLLEYAANSGLALDESYIVGDRWRDIEAGRAAGCKTILIDRGYSERGACCPDHLATDLRDAAEWILRRSPWVP
jgi:D-glycero-D-manno-heptose 1,7-bisphosphate phosphatase